MLQCKIRVSEQSLTFASTLTAGEARRDDEGPCSMRGSTHFPVRLGLYDPRSSFSLVAGAACPPAFASVKIDPSLQSSRKRRATRCTPCARVLRANRRPGDLKQTTHARETTNGRGVA